MDRIGVNVYSVRGRFRGGVRKETDPEGSERI